MRFGIKAFKFKRLIEPLGLTGGKNPDWSLWVEVGQQSYNVRQKQEFGAEGLLRMPLVQCALKNLDPDETVSSSELKGLDYPISAQVSIKELCSLALTVGDPAPVNWLLARLGQASVERYLQSVGCKKSSLQTPFSKGQEIAGQDNYTCLRDAMRLLSISSDQPDQARWLKRNHRNRFIADWMPDTLDVWSQGGISGSTVYDVAIIGDRPRWLIGYLVKNQADPEVCSLHIAHQALRVRQALIAEGIVNPGD